MGTRDLSAPEPTVDPELLQRAAHVIRGLSMDGVQKANSGHPGLPLGAADIATVLWVNFLKHNPKDPSWADRDRFVLSAGHGSMLLYSLLHLSGYDLPMSELENFRQWGSLTPGHPEHKLTPGVETTTGPLGQGIANAVGMALAEQMLAARFNSMSHTVVDHYTYVLASDGDLMEGISHEVCSLAGHLGLGKLIVLYDDNGISIDGETSLAFSEDIPARFESYGWHVSTVDGHDMQAVSRAIAEARSESGKPSLISCKTVIGFGSPNRAATSKAHGEPLGEDEVRLTKAKLGLPQDETFFVPEDVKTMMRSAVERGAAAHEDWRSALDAFSRAKPEQAAVFKRTLTGALPSDWDSNLPEFGPDGPIATRSASGKTLGVLGQRFPELVGGSADLTPSNNTKTPDAEHVRRDDFSGRYLHFGVREHGMAAIANGMVLHGGLLPYVGTFLVFSDYMRPSIRLAALMELRTLYVFTHDSIGLGEDGPTHQPVEHLAALRAMPNLAVFRPADANETVQCWKAAIARREGPCALVLSRQKLPVLDREADGLRSAAGALKGAYILAGDVEPDVILIATGSEVHLALDARERLLEQSIKANVVSMVCTEVFDAQPVSYRQLILPDVVDARVVIEAGATGGWYKYAGSSGVVAGLDRFGASAPYQDVYKGLGITVDAIVQAAVQAIDQSM